ncbi:MAG TPA: hypothetical protein VFA90_01220 [Terriglobales bacterium]|nr:hypothetical protein [Terriglobales bacterium]
MNRLVDSARSSKSFFHPELRAIGFGLLVLIFLVVADQLSIYYGLRESQRVLDDLSGAVIAGLLIYRHEYARSKYLSEKLKTIEMMNHHVRNALQVIVDSAYVHGHAEQLKEIQDSVSRIDWALREILPGRVLDQYDAPAKTQTRAGRSAA